MKLFFPHAEIEAASSMVIHHVHPIQGFEGNYGDIVTNLFLSHGRLSAASPHALSGYLCMTTSSFAFRIADPIINMFGLCSNR